ncbi:S9 family peptidase [Lysobacter sp. S4-A87]|uniref:alpha/beta hydrolase family protein n=1 Tax=Lysobacter sp. S4-A87 TaxID=2925843 RepID=UPI001F539437|nr:S9 family peptidase [Lysobacter sp. S4-A87]UNK48050.1 S9 family peptidase [Lysobacter sp. S4-A87]
MKVFRRLLVVMAMAVTFPAVAQVDVPAFLKKDSFGAIKISPTGEYYAATVPLVDRTVLVVIRRADKTFTAKVSGGENSEVDDFWWVNDERVVISMAERFSTLEKPLPTGELHAINADGSSPKKLVGNDESTALVQVVKFDGFTAAYLIDDLPADDRNVLISVQAYSANPQTRIDQLNVYSGRQSTVATAPVRRARFTTDRSGEVRFARGAGNDNFSKLYYREGRDGDWRLINDEATSGHVEWALGFAADNRTAYLQVERERGPDAIVAMDMATGQRRELLADPNVDPYQIIFDHDGSVPVGATYMRERIESRFFDETSTRARLQRMLEKAFANQTVEVTSSTADGRLCLVLVSSDRNPGDFYLFDTQSRHASLLFSRAGWLDPGKMAPTRSIELAARDGVRLHGYLTLPPGSTGKNLPMVVVPHGGPFGLFDEIGFGRESQILAAAGYAVLQVNFRGSGNYGRSFLQAGARQFGGTMQDDVTDATRWAIDQGIADRKRLCIYGASYGGYAAMMGAAREPDLYACAAGYVGVYDLPMKHEANSSEARWMRNWSNDWMGERDTLEQRSPNRIADRIKVPVFLAAGGKDEIAPIKHSKLMEASLRSAGVPVETLYFPTEGHGFYTQEHQTEFYGRLLDFLGRHLGGAKAGSGAASAAK